MNTQKRQVMEYELGRYKKKVEDQQKEIKELKEQIDGYQEMLDICNAMVTAAVKEVGTMNITQEAINAILESGRFAVGSYDAVTRVYTLEVRSDGGETC